MARPIRIEFENACYHIVAYGNEHRAIFSDDEDRQLFTTMLRQTASQHGVVLMAWVLMENHYHLLLQTPRANLSQAIGWLQTTYTIRYNQRHRRTGHLFRGRFKSHLIDPSLYASDLIPYIHLNPFRRKENGSVVITPRTSLDSYTWSTHRYYAGGEDFPDWVSQECLKYFGEAGTKSYRTVINTLIQSSECPQPWKNLRGGLVLGGDDLWAKVQTLVENKGGQDEQNWTGLRRQEKHLKKLESILPEIDDWRVRLWAKIRLGGLRAVDVAREEGYKDGSGVLQVVKRVEKQAQSEPWMGTRLETLTQLMHEDVKPQPLHVPSSLPVELL